MSSNPEQHLPPGFRFHPTDEELILYYLRNRAASLPCPVPIIAEVDIYKFNPWDLPAKAVFGDREWYFFTPRDRKYPNGVRPNRAAASGYWKATGTDKPIACTASAGGRRLSVGVKKALVFYRGKPPKGSKTSWIMHEYRLAESPSKPQQQQQQQTKDCSSMRLDDWVLCRIYKKNCHHTASAQVEAVDGGEEEIRFPTTTTTEPVQVQVQVQQQQHHQQQQHMIVPLPPPAAHPSDIPKSASMTDLFQDADFSVLFRLLHDDTPPDAAATLQHHLTTPSHWQQHNTFLTTSACASNNFNVPPTSMVAAVPRPPPPPPPCESSATAAAGASHLLDLKLHQADKRLLHHPASFDSFNHFNSTSELQHHYSHLDLGFH